MKLRLLFFLILIIGFSYLNTGRAEHVTIVTCNTLGESPFDGFGKQKHQGRSPSYRAMDIGARTGLFQRWFNGINPRVNAFCLQEWDGLLGASLTPLSQLQATVVPGAKPGWTVASITEKLLGGCKGYTVAKVAKNGAPSVFFYLVSAHLDMGASGIDTIFILLNSGEYAGKPAVICGDFNDDTRGARGPNPYTHRGGTGFADAVAQASIKYTSCTNWFNWPRTNRGVSLQPADRSMGKAGPQQIDYILYRGMTVVTPAARVPDITALDAYSGTLIQTPLLVHDDDNGTAGKNWFSDHCAITVTFDVPTGAPSAPVPATPSRPPALPLPVPAPVIALPQLPNPWDSIHELRPIRSEFVKRSDLTWGPQPGSQPQWGWLHVPASQKAGDGGITDEVLIAYWGDGPKIVVDEHKQNGWLCNFRYINTSGDYLPSGMDEHGKSLYHWQSDTGEDWSVYRTWSFRYEEGFGQQLPSRWQYTPETRDYRKRDLSGDRYISPTHQVVDDVSLADSVVPSNPQIYYQKHPFDLAYVYELTGTHPSSGKLGAGASSHDSPPPLPPAVPAGMHDISAVVAPHESLADCYWLTVPSHSNKKVLIKVNTPGQHPAIAPGIYVCPEAGGAAGKGVAVDHRLCTPDKCNFKYVRWDGEILPSAPMRTLLCWQGDHERVVRTQTGGPWKLIGSSYKQGDDGSGNALNVTDAQQITIQHHPYKQTDIDGYLRTPEPVSAPSGTGAGHPAVGAHAGTGDIQVLANVLKQAAINARHLVSALVRLSGH
jgi:hypothetical protein